MLAVFLLRLLLIVSFLLLFHFLSTVRLLEWLGKLLCDNLCWFLQFYARVCSFFDVMRQFSQFFWYVVATIAIFKYIYAKLLAIFAIFTHEYFSFFLRVTVFVQCLHTYILTFWYIRIIFSILLAYMIIFELLFLFSFFCD